MLHLLPTWLQNVNWSTAEGLLSFVVAIAGTLGLTNRIIKVWVKQTDDRYNKRTISWEQLYKDAINKLLSQQSVIDSKDQQIATLATALASSNAERDALRTTVQAQNLAIATLTAPRGSK